MSKRTRRRLCPGIGAQLCGRVTPPGERFCRACSYRVQTDPYRQADYRHNRTQLLATATHCAICKRKPTERNRLTADHIVPIADGGSNTRSNLRAVCLSCNSRRGDGR